MNQGQLRMGDLDLCNTLSDCVVHYLGCKFFGIKVFLRIICIHILFSFKIVFTDQILLSALKFEHATESKIENSLAKLQKLI